MTPNRSCSAVVILATLIAPASLPAFQGRIEAELTRGAQTVPLRYTIGANTLRIERTGSGRPAPQNLVALDSGAITLVYPHNRSFVHLPQTDTSHPNASTVPRIFEPPALPVVPGAGAVPAMPMIPRRQMEPLELTATGEQTNLLGYACNRYQVRQRAWVVAIWATDQMLPFQPWTERQARSFGPRGPAEQWPDLLKAESLFPLRVTVRFEQAPERLLFEVKSIRSEEITDPDGSLFRPPAGFHEREPNPF